MPKYQFEKKEPIKRCKDCFAFYIDEKIHKCLLDESLDVWWAMEKPDNCPLQEV